MKVAKKRQTLTLSRILKLKMRMMLKKKMIIKKKIIMVMKMKKKLLKNMNQKTLLEQII